MFTRGIFLLTLLISLTFQCLAQNQNRALVVGSSLREVKARNELKPKDNLSFFGFEADTVKYYLCDRCVKSLDDKYPADLVALAFYQDTLYRITFAYKMLKSTSAANYKKVGKVLAKRYNCDKVKKVEKVITSDIVTSKDYKSTIERSVLQQCSYNKSMFKEELVKTINQGDQSFKEYGTFTYFDPEISPWFDEKGDQKTERVK